jgi:hypothetical protein
METFGQRVRQAIEHQGLPLHEVAEATGLGIEHIQALEHDDFGRLPGDEIVHEGLRSFARLVDVEPEVVIADYCRERQRWFEAKAAGGAARDAGESPGVDATSGVPEGPRGAGRARPAGFRHGWMAGLAATTLALASVAFLLWPRTSPAPGPGRPEADARQAPVTSPHATEPSLARERQVVASGLSVAEHGVGRGVAGHELVGESRRFTAGERAWFWTRIEGGAPGGVIDHVWLHDGREALRVRLELGGARWRTQSYKDLGPGSEGAWAVEARDEAGQVLARRDFRCVAPQEAAGLIRR